MRFYISMLQISFLLFIIFNIMGFQELGIAPQYDPFSGLQEPHVTKIR